ncbi:MAG TPA: peptidylprolyl isomerase, partial [Candidatus Aminicenantes bacterium]|nr:peptidylprolyl isomerase [Candidatus Aminicenantes bacterium]
GAARSKSLVTPLDAVQAEWSRRPPRFSAVERSVLVRADRARLDLTLRRIGAPGAVSLLPPELDKPTLEAWEKKARAARTPEERFTALAFLNRLGSKHALSALAGLTPQDASTWPRFLHLEFPVANARLRGEEIEPGLAAFLAALEPAGKVDPVRAASARLRLVLAGIEPNRLPGLEPTPGAVLTLLESWNRTPWDRRAITHQGLLEAVRSGDPAQVVSAPWGELGLSRPPLAADGTFPQRAAILIRLLEGLPDPSPVVSLAGAPLPPETARPAVLTKLATLLRFPAGAEARRELAALRREVDLRDPLLLAALLPVLRKFEPGAADALAGEMLVGREPLARAAAIDDLAAPPVDLDGLENRVWTDAEYDSAQVWFAALKRWHLPAQEQKRRLLHWRTHPNWSRRYDSYLALRELDPRTSWPPAPTPTERDREILALAEKLTVSRKVVRLRVDFAGGGSLVMRLDGSLMPINTANLVLLAREGFFNGLRVPRVVPDFVVQMGSPFGTMDGGPGY